jgi:hypothetical protein
MVGGAESERVLSVDGVTGGYEYEISRLWVTKLDEVATEEDKR